MSAVPLRLTLLAALCLAPAPVLAQARGAGALEVPAPAAVSTQGRVLRAGTRDPVVGAVVRVVGRSGSAVTGTRGEFAVPMLPAGAWTFTVTEQGRPERSLTAVVKDPAAPLTLYLWAPASSDVVVVTGRREDAPVAERTLSAGEIAQLPGAYGDPVRAIQGLPGVGRAPFGSPFLIIRGSDIEDSGYYVDGMRIPQVFHFLGVTTVVNAEILSQVEFRPGGYGVYYGRKLQGVVDLQTEPAHYPRHHGSAEVDLFDTTLFGSGPLPGGTGYTFSVRRTYIDTLAEPVLSRVELPYQFELPRYWDYQAAADWERGDRHHVRLLVLGSDDRAAVFGDVSSEQGAEQLEKLADYVTTFTQVQLRVQSVVGEGLVAHTTLSLGPQRRYTAIGEVVADLTPFTVDLREELRWRSSQALVMSLGLDSQLTHDVGRLELPFDPGTDGEFEWDAWTFSPSVYAEGTWSGLPPLVLTAGLRVDPLLIQGQPGLVAADPRAAARYALSEEALVKASLGQYSAFPLPYENLEGIGDPTLGPEHAVQATLGYERGLPMQLRLDTQLFGTLSFDRVAYESGAQDTTAAEGEALFSLGNQGQGRAAGLELLLRRDFGYGWWGWIAYTLSRSEQRGAPEDDWLLFGFDQTHILTLMSRVELGERWRLGARWSYSTGYPYTPVIGRVYDLDTNSYTPIMGEVNSVRYPSAHSLDVRIDRSWTFPRWKLDAFLDVFNAYNHRNVEAHYYSWDYAQQYFVGGVPIIPSIGVKGSW